MVIGGGAAGFFAAINAAEQCNARLIILEKSQKLLSKVRVSGGGRCNVTNHTFNIADLVTNYPRGAQMLKKVFPKFGVQETINWFEERGVKLHAEDDGRMFPVSNNSQSIINCFLSAAQKNNIEIKTGFDVSDIFFRDGKIVISGEEQLVADAAIVTAGGFPKLSGYDFLKSTQHTIIQPLPSLFTFNIPNDEVTKLMGVSVKKAEVKIAGTRLKYMGPVLITHWGFSGPAVLKLSAFAAELFHEKNYNAEILINWSGKKNEEEVRTSLSEVIKQKGNAFPSNTNFCYLPDRLWSFLLRKSEINPDKNWSEQSRRSLNKLISHLSSDSYTMKGKTTFKEEFVTCGGINLSEVSSETIESKLVPGLYFAGEVLNIDGITGGFNFQAAWSTAFVAARSIAAKMQ